MAMGVCDPDSKSKVRGVKELKRVFRYALSSTTCPLSICNIRYKGIRNHEQPNGQQKLVTSYTEQLINLEVAIHSFS